jgi:hypothetical protein
MRKRLTRPLRRLTFTYRLHCAREDAKLRNIVAPIGERVCEHCRHVSLTVAAHLTHRAHART